MTVGPVSTSNTGIELVITCVNHVIGSTLEDPRAALAPSCPNVPSYLGIVLLRT